MERRQFLIGTAAALGVPVVASSSESHAVTNGGTERTYHILGVPLRSGSLVPGNENDAQAYREAQLLKRLQEAGCRVVDAGDVAIPSYLPHHSVPPIRSWPGPRIAWDCVKQSVLPILQVERQVPLLIGCDCSVVVGTVQALLSAAQDVHVLYVDGDFDDASPVPGHCNSGAACAVWLLTHNSPFREGPTLGPSQVSVVGWSSPSKAANPEVGSLSLAEIRHSGASDAARQVLQTIPASAQILVHLDIDVICKEDMPVAYFPHEQGLSLLEARELLGVLLKDPRIRIIEISEYAALRDLGGSYVSKLVDLLVEGLKPR